MRRLVCRCDAPLGLAIGAPGLTTTSKDATRAPSLTTDAPLGVAIGAPRLTTTSKDATRGS